MIINKRIAALKHLVSPDKLRTVLTGIHWNKESKCFEATDSIILGRYYPNLEYKNEDYPYVSDQIKDELSDCILDTESITNLAKSAKANKTMPLIDSTILISDKISDDPDTQKVIGVTNACNSPVVMDIKTIDGAYPKCDMIFPDDNSLKVSMSFNAKKLETILKTIKDLANPVTHQMILNYFPERKLSRIDVENSNTGDKFTGLIMGSSSDNISVPKYIVKYFIYREDEYQINNFLTTEYSDIITDKYDIMFQVNKKAKQIAETPYNRLVYFKVYTILTNEPTLERYMYDFEKPKPKEEDPLTPEEQDLYNEVFDGEGCSDDASVIEDKIEAAEKSIQTPVEKFVDELKEKITEAVEEEQHNFLEACNNDCENCNEDCPGRTAEYITRTLADKESDPTPNEYPNTGKRWSQAEDEKLEFLYKAGKTLEDLCYIHGRDKNSILRRISYMIGAGIINKRDDFNYDKPMPKHKFKFRLYCANCKKLMAQSDESLVGHPDLCPECLAEKATEENKNSVVKMPNGYKEYTSPIQLRAGKKVILKSGDEFNAVEQNDAMKIVMKTIDLAGKKCDIANVFGTMGFSITDAKMYLLPYNLIKYIGE